MNESLKGAVYVSMSIWKAWMCVPMWHFAWYSSASHDSVELQWYYTTAHDTRYYETVKDTIQLHMILIYTTAHDTIKLYKIL